MGEPSFWFDTLNVEPEPRPVPLPGLVWDARMVGDGEFADVLRIADPAAFTSPTVEVEGLGELRSLYAGLEGFSPYNWSGDDVVETERWFDTVRRYVDPEKKKYVLNPETGQLIEITDRFDPELVGRYLTPLIPDKTVKYNSNVGTYVYAENDNTARWLAPKDAPEAYQNIKQAYEQGAEIYMPAATVAALPVKPRMSNKGFDAFMSRHGEVLAGALVGLATMNPWLGAGAGALAGVGRNLAQDGNALDYLKAALSGGLAGYATGSLAQGFLAPEATAEGAATEAAAGTPATATPAPPTSPAALSELPEPAAVFSEPAAAGGGALPEVPSVADLTAGTVLGEGAPLPEFAGIPSIGGTGVISTSPSTLGGTGLINPVTGMVTDLADLGTDWVYNPITDTLIEGIQTGLNPDWIDPTLDLPGADLIQEGLDQGVLLPEVPEAETVIPPATSGAALDTLLDQGSPVPPEPSTPPEPPEEVPEVPPPATETAGVPPVIDTEGIAPPEPPVPTPPPELPTDLPELPPITMPDPGVDPNILDQVGNVAEGAAPGVADAIDWTQLAGQLAGVLGGVLGGFGEVERNRQAQALKNLYESRAEEVQKVYSPLKGPLEEAFGPQGRFARLLEGSLIGEANTKLSQDLAAARASAWRYGGASAGRFGGDVLRATGRYTQTVGLAPVLAQTEALGPTQQLALADLGLDFSGGGPNPYNPYQFWSGFLGGIYRGTNQPRAL